jgi:hypothetical protein
MPTKRTREEQAAYMRDYRDRKAHAKVEGQVPLAIPVSASEDPRDARIADLVAENARLVDEVKVLKALLAQRTPAAIVPATGANGPAMAALPEMERAPGGDLESLFAAPIRAMSQTERDAVLRKVSPARGRER